LALEFCFPLPENIDDKVAAALPNPGVSAWLSLTFRGKLLHGESVLILGATGVTGRLAVRIAKLLGAARLVAAGRNRQVLNTLPEFGADTNIRLDVSDDELREAFASAVRGAGFQVVLDYLWGRPVEILLSAMTRKEFSKASLRLGWCRSGKAPAQRSRSRPQCCGALISQSSVRLEFHLVTS